MGTTTTTLGHDERTTSARPAAAAAAAAAAAVAAPTLHVVHVVLTLNVGGLERNVVNQVREGQRLGQRVTIVCLECPGKLATQVEAMGERVISLGKRPGLQPKLIAQLVRVFRALRPDVVHTHQLATLLYGGAAARLVRVPVVLHTEHGREPYRTRRKTRMLARVAGSFADRFYCLTGDMAEEVRAAKVVSDEKVRVIQNGIDLSTFTAAEHERAAATRHSLGVPLDAPLIGTVGRLTEVKRQDVLLNAFAKVRQRVPDAHLVLVGDGPQLSDLQALAGRLGVTEAVHFAGYQPSSAPYLEAMDVFALTSRSEGMPQAAIEASATALPVVASRVGGLPELIEDGVSGVLFPVGDVDGLAAHLLRLLSDRVEARGMGQAAKERAISRFSVSRMAREYHEDALSIMRGRAATVSARDRAAAV